MARLWDVDYSDLANRINDWKKVSGSSVTNLALDLLNRAQRRLVDQHNWDYLIKEAVALTLSSGNTYTTPSDLYKIVQIGLDNNSDGKVDWHYFKQGRVGQGYSISPTFTKAGGFSAFNIVFHSAVNGTPVVTYQVGLDDFAATGTEKSFFPAEVIVAMARLIHADDGGPTGRTSRADIKDALKDVLEPFKSAHQYINQNMEQILYDDIGNEIFFESYSLDGPGVPQAPISPFERSFLPGLG